jgi:hypothetical protein
MTSLLKKNWIGAAIVLATLGVLAQATVVKAESDFEVVSYVAGADPVTQPESFVTDSNGNLWAADAWKDTLGF